MGQMHLFALKSYRTDIMDQTIRHLTTGVMYNYLDDFDDDSTPDFWGDFEPEKQLQSDDAAVSLDFGMKLHDVFLPDDYRCVISLVQLCGFLHSRKFLDYNLISPKTRRWIELVDAYGWEKDKGKVGCLGASKRELARLDEWFNSRNQNKE